MSRGFIRENKEQVPLIQAWSSQGKCCTYRKDCSCTDCSCAQDSVPASYLNKCLMQSFFRNLRFSLQQTSVSATGARDVRLAPDRVLGSEHTPWGRAHVHRHGLVLSWARARQYTHWEQSTALGIVEGALQRMKYKQAQTPSHSKQRFVAQFCGGRDPIF